MKRIKSLLPVLLAAASLMNTESLSAQLRRDQETNFDRQMRQKDNQPTRDFVQSKEDIELKEKATNLEISGDVRFEWRRLYEFGDYIYFKEDDDAIARQQEEFDALQAEGKIPSDSELFRPTNKKFKQHYQSLRGPGDVDYRGLPLSHNDWDVEFNLKFKYTFEKAWMAAHLNFDNGCGVRGFNEREFGLDIRDFCDTDDEIVVRRNRVLAIKGSGESNRVNLKRAYMGYNLWADGVHRFDIEVGRRKLEDAFDSEIQFSSRFDGVLLKYATAFEDVADFYWNLGAFVIDERVNHLGYATEFGFLNIYDTGINLKYSFIDWVKRGTNRDFARDPLGTDFQNSQFSFEYHFNPEFFCKSYPAEFYGEFLVNHAARKTIFTHYKKENFAWHLGLYIGGVKKAGDWAVDLEYVYLQAQAVSDDDVGSIGRGNILDECLVDVVFDPKNSIEGEVFVILDEDDNIIDIIPANGHGSDLSDVTSSSFSSRSCSSASSSSSSDRLRAVGGLLPRRGNANFKGWRFDVLYGLTDNLSLEFTYEVSSAVNKKIGGDHFFTHYELEAIYAF